MRAFLGLILTALLAFPLLAAEPTETTKFLRIHRDQHNRAMSLDTAVVRYRNSDGVTVDLIGAVHIGERFYYQALNKRMRTYDAMLYELVAEKGDRPGKRQADEEGDESPLHKVQSLVSNVLGLQHQLNCIDYNRPNFVHADLSPADLKKRMEDRGESPMVYFLETMANTLKEQNKAREKPKVGDDDIDEDELVMGLIQGILLEKPSPIVKRYMALQFDDMDNQMKAFGGGLGRLIVEDRNTACFDVLKAQIKGGKTKLGVFYGAAHLPDMEKRLVQMGFHKTDAEWLEAWLLR
jgi:hypothetical protein